MKAKTNKSNNNWTAPQSLRTFGIPVVLKNKILYLGSEEFNFSTLLSKFQLEGDKVAYIPAFSSFKRSPNNKLDLFYNIGNGNTVFYATMYEVVQIENPEVPILRKMLIAAGFPHFVAKSSEFQAIYSHLFPQALKIWDRNFEQNNIIAPGSDPRFVLNVKYKSIEFKYPHINVNWGNLKRARLLYS